MWHINNSPADTLIDSIFRKMSTHKHSKWPIQYKPCPRTGICSGVCPWINTIRSQHKQHIANRKTSIASKELRVMATLSAEGIVRASRLCVLWFSNLWVYLCMFIHLLILNIKNLNTHTHTYPLPLFHSSKNVSVFLFLKIVLSLILEHLSSSPPPIKDNT